MEQQTPQAQAQQQAQTQPEQTPPQAQPQEQQAQTQQEQTPPQEQTRLAQSRQVLQLAGPAWPEWWSQVQVGQQSAQRPRAQFEVVVDWARPGP